MIKRIGVLGGAGPLASAAFVNSIYESAAGKSEQKMPKIFLISDPDIPDRTNAILNGCDSLLLESINEKLKIFDIVTVDNIVICCLAMHHFLPKISQKYREHIISILDYAINYIAQQETIVLCSFASRISKLFESDPRWINIKSHAIFLDENDQALLDTLIKDAKFNVSKVFVVNRFSDFLQKFRNKNMIIACSELHMLFSKLQQQGIFSNIYDPFLDIARYLSE